MDRTADGAGGRIELAIALAGEEAAALDIFCQRQAEGGLNRAELARRILVDRLVHEGLLPEARAYSGRSRAEGLKTEDLNASNDD
jgi:hypothetical protein